MNGHIKRVLAIAAVCALIGAGANLAYGFNPFSKKDWEQVGKSIKNAAQTAADWVQSIGNKIAKELNQVKECIQVVPLGTQWVSQRASYYVATAVLQAAQTLQQADPVLTGYRAQVAALQTQIAAVQALQATANAGLTATQALADATAAAVQAFGTAVGGASAVKKFGAKASFADLMALKLPQFTLVVNAGGRDITIDKLPVDFSSVTSLTKSIIPAVKSIIATLSGGKVSKDDLDKAAPDNTLA